MADKNRKNVTKPKKELQSRNTKNSDKNSKKEKQLTFDAQSDRMIHQILPFVFVVLAILFEVCFVLASLTGEEYVGVAGVFLKNTFLGLFGTCAFLVPLLLLNLAGNWRKFVDSKVVTSKIIFSILFLISLSGVFHIYMRPAISAETEVFLLPKQIFEHSYSNIFSSGLVGGFVCECIYALFKSVGTTIIMFALTLIFFIFSLGMTPRNMAIWIRYKWQLMKEKRDARREEERIALEERKKEEERQFIAEKARIDAERKAAEEARQKEMDDKVAAAEKLALERERKAKEEAEATDSIIIRDSNAISVEEEVNAEGGNVLDLEKIFRNPSESVEPVVNPAPILPPPVEAEPDPVPVEAPVEEASDIEIKKNTEVETYTENSEEEEDATPYIPREYVRPPVDLLKSAGDVDYDKMDVEAEAGAHRLAECFTEYKVKVQQITYTRGPRITRYEVVPAPGVRTSAIVGLNNEISLKMGSNVRISSVLDKSAIGIEVPNKNITQVTLRSLLEDNQFVDEKKPLTMALGKNMAGENVYFNLQSMPHLLIAGSTGSGKSVCINCAIISLLYKVSPRDVKIILVDPKRVELKPYSSIPHLYAPIVTDPKKAAGALAAAVAEMDRRYSLMERVGAKNIESFNEKAAKDPELEHLPYIVIVIDELADLMMTAANDVETALCRLAQLARASGIHLIVGTQRPSVDIVTGLIKSNFPSRIAFAVASAPDAKTILNEGGAEKLLGRGDMLFAPQEIPNPVRLQGAFVSESEIERVVEFVRDNNEEVCFNDEFMANIERASEEEESGDIGGSYEEGEDPKFKLALDVAIQNGRISTSLLQRRLKIGYGRAAGIIDRMDELGYLGPSEGGNKGRPLLVTRAEIMEKRLNESNNE